MTTPTWSQHGLSGYLTSSDLTSKRSCEKNEKWWNGPCYIVLFVFQFQFKMMIVLEAVSLTFQALHASAWVCMREKNLWKLYRKVYLYHNRIVVSGWRWLINDCLSSIMFRINSNVKYRNMQHITSDCL